jgi:hypothetical protein
VLPGCSVCDACCKSWLINQDSCDGCFHAPVADGGCGGQTKESGQAKHARGLGGCPRRNRARALVKTKISAYRRNARK